MPRNPRVKLYPPGVSAPRRLGSRLADIPHAERGYGRDDRNTNLAPFYRDHPAFNEGALAMAALTPSRKTAQYAFAGGATPTLALPANYLRCYLIIQNRSGATNLFIGFGSGADQNTGILILPNGGNLLCDYSPPTDDVYIFFAAGAAEVCTICEGVYQPQAE